jgi:hypothetical protein
MTKRKMYYFKGDMMAATAAMIRVECPNPKSTGNSMLTDGYCVGGAVCLWALEHSYLQGQLERFPSVDELANVLQVLNGHLSRGNALDYADCIIFNNDTDDFEGAWDAVDRALTIV